MVLFKEAKKKSEIKRAAEAACQAKEKDKEPEKRDIHVDLREQKQQDGAPRPRLLPWPLVPWRLSEGGSTVPESLRCCARNVLARAPDEIEMEHRVVASRSVVAPP